ncbi:MAG: hypothetical protein IJU81_07725 [Bacteroidales bacterium]|nr:hypothetical protein [Bacteroidales bacterium]
MTEASSYRPRNPGHDYYGRGVYLVTLVVSGRRPLLSQLVSPPLATKPLQSGPLVLTPLGEAVHQAWLQTPALQAKHGNHVAVHACICMPDHFHGVIEVKEPMSWSLGTIIQSFKSACTSRLHELQGLPNASYRPLMVDCQNPNTPSWLREKAAHHHTEGSLLSVLSKKQRQEYYAMAGQQKSPLFDDNYDDTVCLDERHREAMIAYVHDNPRRALLRRMLPDVMRRSLHVTIGNRSYGTFGNLFLLRWANKVQVQCHRRHPATGEPYESTAEYTHQHTHWLAAILGGQTVIVTPGISRGEQMIKNECIENGYPLIHLQKEPIGPYWKPELRRFEACANGSLLILAPWNLDEMGNVAGVPSDSDYSRFHNLNTLATEICTFSGEAKIIKQ